MRVIECMKKGLRLLINKICNLRYQGYFLNSSIAELFLSLKYNLLKLFRQAKICYIVKTIS